jgi:prophage maintenance system killer protein
MEMFGFVHFAVETTLPIHGKSRMPIARKVLPTSSRTTAMDDQIKIAIYQAENQSVEVHLQGETVWLRQEQMAELFGRDRTVISRHIRNVFAEGELVRESNVQNLHIANSDKPVSLYSLDVIISVGYRVKSAEGVRFRQWATQILRDHLTLGYTLSRQRFEANALELEAALSRVRRLSANPEISSDAGRGLADIVSRYAQTFLLLQRYDEGLLAEPVVQAGGSLPSASEARLALEQLKASLMSRGEATELFARERGDGLAALLGNLDQSVFGEPAYPSVEAKAAHLLYFVIKNHPFTDGNKRSGAFLFVDFLNRNGRLLDIAGQPVINDIGLAALALLVAESDPTQKDTLIRLIINMLAPVGAALRA